MGGGGHLQLASILPQTLVKISYGVFKKKIKKGGKNINVSLSTQSIAYIAITQTL